MSDSRSHATSALLDHPVETRSFRATSRSMAALLHKLTPVSYTHLTLPTIYSV